MRSDFWGLPWAAQRAIRQGEFDAQVARRRAWTVQDLEKQVASLMEALKPFAEHSDFYAPDEWPVTFIDPSARTPGVTAGDFRRAREAYAKINGEA